MKTRIVAISLFACVALSAFSQSPQMDVLAFSIAAPKPDRLDQFLKFMEEDLAGNGINTLILRVDYDYEYESYPRREVCY